MESQLKEFEEYIAALTGLGVYPTFNRYYNGWTCVLRNSVNHQIMPFDQKDNCWAETLLGALTIAVNLLNEQFPDPKHLHKYIATGIDQNVDSILQNIESFHDIRGQKNGKSF